MKARRLLAEGRCCLSLTLACLLVSQTLPLDISAQETPPPKLRIVVLEGEGAINNIRLRTAREPVVQVVDENNKPISGALVIFILPDNGASGVFANGSKNLMAYTDPQGRVAAKGLQPNKITGKYKIQVNASSKGQSASTTINQENALVGAAVAGGITGKLIAILAIAGGAAATGAIVASRSGSKAPAPVPSATINAPGTPTFGPPQ